MKLIFNNYPGGDEGAPWILKDEGPRWRIGGEKPRNSRLVDRKGGEELKGASRSRANALAVLGRGCGRGRLSGTIRGEGDLALGNNLLFARTLLLFRHTVGLWLWSVWAPWLCRAEVWSLWWPLLGAGCALGPEWAWWHLLLQHRQWMKTHNSPAPTPQRQWNSPGDCPWAGVPWTAHWVLFEKIHRASGLSSEWGINLESPSCGPQGSELPAPTMSSVLSGL